MAFFCSHCGEVWERLQHDPNQWEVYYRDCPRHGEGSCLSHLITEKNTIPSHAANTVEHLPIHILKREFEIALREGKL